MAAARGGALGLHEAGPAASCCFRQRTNPSTNAAKPGGSAPDPACRTPGQRRIVAIPAGSSGVQSPYPKLICQGLGLLEIPAAATAPPPWASNSPEPGHAALKPGARPSACQAVHGPRRLRGGRAADLDLSMTSSPPERPANAAAVLSQTQDFAWLALPLAWARNPAQGRDLKIHICYPVASRDMLQFGRAARLKTPCPRFKSGSWHFIDQTIQSSVRAAPLRSVSSLRLRP